jgi:hypothetical protein
LTSMPVQSVSRAHFKKMLSWYPDRKVQDLLAKRLIIRKDEPLVHCPKPVCYLEEEESVDTVFVSSLAVPEKLALRSLSPAKPDRKGA